MTNLLSQLTKNAGSTHKRKIVGRGRGSGMGQTSTKGHKGQKARSGGSIRWGFEGGQMPLSRRVPKFGFKNTVFANRYDIINLRDLSRFDGDVDLATLAKRGYLSKNGRIKVLGSGSIEKSIKIQVHAISQSAKAAIEKAGGHVEVIAE